MTPVSIVCGWKLFSCHKMKLGSTVALLCVHIHNENCFLFCFLMVFSSFMFLLLHQQILFTLMTVSFSVLWLFHRLFCFSFQIYFFISIWNKRRLYEMKMCLCLYCVTNTLPVSLPLNYVMTKKCKVHENPLSAQTWNIYNTVTTGLLCLILIVGLVVVFLLYSH